MANLYQSVIQMYSFFFLLLVVILDMITIRFPFVDHHSFINKSPHLNLFASLFYVGVRLSLIFLLITITTIVTSSSSSPPLSLHLPDFFSLFSSLSFSLIV